MSDAVDALTQSASVGGPLHFPNWVPNSIVQHLTRELMLIEGLPAFELPDTLITGLKLCTDDRMEKVWSKLARAQVGDKGYLLFLRTVSEATYSWPYIRRTVDNSTRRETLIKQIDAFVKTLERSTEAGVHIPDILTLAERAEEKNPFYSGHGYFAHWNQRTKTWDPAVDDRPRYERPFLAAIEGFLNDRSLGLAAPTIAAVLRELRDSVSQEHEELKGKVPRKMQQDSASSTYMIKRLSPCMKEIAGSPLHRYVGITIEVALDLGEPVEESRIAHIAKSLS